MNTKSTIILAAALVVAILGAGLLVSGAMANLTLGDAQPVSVPIPAGATSAPAEQDTLTVNSTGTVSIAPDLAFLTLSFSGTGPSSQELNAQLNASLAEMVQDAKALGIDPLDIQTDGISINNYNYYGEAQTFNGDTRVNLKVRDLDNVSKLIDIAAEKPNYTSCYFHFDASDKTDAYDQALAQAAQEAGVKAEKVAASMGRAVGTLLSIEENIYGGISPLTSASAMRADGIVEGGSIEVSVSLTVKYALDSGE